MASSTGLSGLITTRPLSDPPNNNSNNSNNNEEAITNNLTSALKREKAAKRKMYSYLVKIADELKTLRCESEQLITASEYARKAWYEGGMWRGPNVLPGAATVVSSPGVGGGGGGGNGGVASPREGGANGGGGTTAGPMMVPRAPVSLSDLFLDIVT
mmetsp:Transcript_8285/g.15098  ORF Transcript_8285/g.15098 Transcript_8285/m.15098 type:complete len:157 (-) Transcript_8285:480-950(-)